MLVGFPDEILFFCIFTPVAELSYNEPQTATEWAVSVIQCSLAEEEGVEEEEEKGEEGEEEENDKGE